MTGIPVRAPCHHYRNDIIWGCWFTSFKCLKIDQNIQIKSNWKIIPRLTKINLTVGKNDTWFLIYQTDRRQAPGWPFKNISKLLDGYIMAYQIDFDISPSIKVTCIPPPPSGICQSNNDNNYIRVSQWLLALLMLECFLKVERLPPAGAQRLENRFRL